MKYILLNEAILLLRECRSQSNAGGCVNSKIDQVLGKLVRIDVRDYTDAELNTVILNELSNLVSELPEVLAIASELG